jgi:hypothetical protein
MSEERLKERLERLERNEDARGGCFFFSAILFAIVAVVAKEIYNVNLFEVARLALRDWLLR